MIEVSEEVFEQLRADDSIYSIVTFQTPLDVDTIEVNDMKSILTLISQITDEDWIIVRCGQQVGYADYTTVIGTISDMTESDTNLEVIENIIGAFTRGHEENGWTWRSPASIARETQLEVDIVNQVLNDNSELFEVSENGQKWRYTDL